MTMRLILAMLGTGGALVMTSPTWTADIKPLGTNHVMGNTTVTAIGTDSLLATITLSHGESGATLPWHVHLGHCGDGGKILGPAADYMPVKIGMDGTGTIIARVAAAAPSSGDYSVNVHKSPAELPTIIACGNLKSGETKPMKP